MRCGLLGQHLGHSYSPQIHGMLADYEYSLFEKEPDELEDFLKNGAFDGLNVTIPYKQAVIPYLNDLTPIARELGAVNTIIRNNGMLIGHNTDLFGFHALLQHSGLSPAGKKCLVLGSGGASKVVQSVLRMYQANVIVISRTGENNYENMANHRDASILINTTPLGMYPDTGVSPVDLAQFPALEGVLDLVYNPARTQLLLEAEERGLIAENGLYMLVTQAKSAAEFFTDTSICQKKVQEIHKTLKNQAENIILIGMPGCGKTTVGQLLAEKTGRTFADSDALIENLAQKTIPRIFAEDGEETFRKWETMALSQLGKQSGLVLATGGGCVTREKNYPLLHQNGRIIYLRRALEQLPTDGRPLSQEISLQDLFERRRNLYSRFADYIIDNNSTPCHAVDAIMEVIA